MLSERLEKTEYGGYGAIFISVSFSHLSCKILACSYRPNGEGECELVWGAERY